MQLRGDEETVTIKFQALLTLNECQRQASTVLQRSVYVQVCMCVYAHVCAHACEYVCAHM